MRFLLIHWLLLTSTLLPAQNKKVFYIGHSLSDQIPEMVKSLADAHPNVKMNGWAYQSIPGSPLRYNWDAKKRNDYTPIPPHIQPFYHPQNGLANGQFEVLVLTESVPRFPSIIQETYAYADSFYTYAQKHRPNTRVYLYEDWHCLLSGTPTGCAWDINSNPWRQRLADDLPMWEGVVDYLNNKFKPASPVCLIPGGQALAILHDSIQAGKVPGLKNIHELFSDDIHLTDPGKYFMACVHFSTLFGISPEGLPHQLYSMWGGAFKAPTPAQAAAFQRIAWQAATRYRKSCISPTTSATIPPSAAALEVWPNPACQTLYLSQSGPYTVINLLGKVVLLGVGNYVTINSLEDGCYLIQTHDGGSKLFYKHSAF